MQKSFDYLINELNSKLIPLDKETVEEIKDLIDTGNYSYKNISNYPKALEYFSNLGIKFPNGDIKLSVLFPSIEHLTKLLKGDEVLEALSDHDKVDSFMDVYEYEHLLPPNLMDCYVDNAGGEFDEFFQYFVDEGSMIYETFNMYSETLNDFGAFFFNDNLCRLFEKLHPNLINKATLEELRIQYLNNIKREDRFGDGSIDSNVERYLRVLDEDYLLSDFNLNNGRYTFLLNLINDLKYDRIESDEIYDKLNGDFNNRLKDFLVKGLDNIVKNKNYNLLEQGNLSLTLLAKLDMDDHIIDDLLQLSRMTNKIVTIDEFNSYTFINDVIENYIDNAYVADNDGKEVFVMSENQFGFIENVFRSYLNKANDPYDVFYDMPAKIITLMNSEFLPKNYKERLENIYSNFVENKLYYLEEPDEETQKVIDKARNLETLTEEEYEIFSRYAIDEKAKNGMFDSRDIDVFFKYDFEHDQELIIDDTYVVKRVIEDKSILECRDNKVPYFAISFVSDLEDTDTDEVLYGTCSSYRRTIKYSNDHNYLMSLLDTSLHEIQHAIQNEILDNPIASDTMTPLLYDIAKDGINRTIDDPYYEINYNNIQSESDARIAARCKMMQYYATLNLDPKTLIDTIQELKLNSALESDYTLSRQVTRTSDGKDVSLDCLFKEFFESGKVKDYQPEQFDIEFDLDSLERKGNLKILSELADFCSANGVSEDIISIDSEGNEEYDTAYVDRNTTDKIKDKVDLFIHIISNDANPSDNEILEDMKLLSDPKFEQGKFKLLRDKILLRDILPRVLYWKEKGELQNLLLDEGKKESFESLRSFSLGTKDTSIQERIAHSLTIEESLSKTKKTDKMKIEDIITKLPARRVKEAADVVGMRYLRIDDTIKTSDDDE